MKWDVRTLYIYFYTGVTFTDNYIHHVHLCSKCDVRFLTVLSTVL